MSKTKTAGPWNQLQWLVLAIFTMSLPVYSQETSRQDGPVEKTDKEFFSGP